ncbi:substrate-binding domain-containing protein [Aestuariicoccus sp. MJ-SS9]|uniref:substrate-binding domain-containing protein n=1 Tax=Aestuariicoccus sp. MJ-SS9 TaxID=3079855 RepID=UPI00290D5525|nr:substrate-binding domain-containing protein [Aestuariicoccus sp. MJ-SS9]MDU8913976.1 substrate-binding domain-containing protein [Aestuariicoccus sp. MJ-SS9]
MDRLPNLRILSAGAPKTGVRLCAEAFASATMGTVEIEFATAPEVRERMASGFVDADIVVAPVAAIEEFAASGALIVGSSVLLGSISAGVAVRRGAQVPDLHSAASLREALLTADLLIYNRASSGQYIHTMIERLGLSEAVAGKTLRTDTGADAMAYLANDRSERAIGFGQITEIRLKEGLGIQLVGPLPEELGKKTSYSAAVSTSARNPDRAKDLLAHFTSEEGRGILLQSGIE